MAHNGALRRRASAYRWQQKLSAKRVAALPMLDAAANSTGKIVDQGMGTQTLYWGTPGNAQ